MRAHLLARAAEEATIEPEEAAPRTPEEQAWRLLVMHSGPRAAAWLIGKATVGRKTVRTILHERGVVDFTLPAKMSTARKESLRWVFVALECLKRRPGWSVETFTHRGIRRYRVKWYTWRHWGAQRAVS